MNGISEWNASTNDYKCYMLKSSNWQKYIKNEKQLWFQKYEKTFCKTDDVNNKTSDLEIH